MRIMHLKVEDFRAIRTVHLRNLKEMVVIAGPNGCGKSCILDAIRLFKSVYGGYQPNEWQQWMNEFQINLREQRRMASLLRQGDAPAIIEAQIELADHERQFIEQNIDSLLEDLAWRAVAPGMSRWLGSANPLATELRAHEPAVRQHVEQLRPVIVQQLNNRLLTGVLTILPDGKPLTQKSELLELVFSAFHPRQIGVIDYHGAHRNYAREELGGINLNLDQEEERLRSTSLYNAANKYTNIKSEMAAEYVKQTLSNAIADVGVMAASQQDITRTMQELFGTFFPGKRFGGPVPTDDGNLGFPVEMDDGSTHDINDLSSGEKEILFGYLRIRSSAPGYSVILMDEPELHLNPALIRGLPQFYQRHLGSDLDNQVWLVTHSDAFLREALGHEGLQVFHMRHASVLQRGENQMREVRLGDEVESIVLEMVGNLASYNPGSKVLFLEGENSKFDQRMVSTLFPAIENSINLVSAGSRLQVERLHQVLEKSAEAGNIPVKIYSVVDRDMDSGEPVDGFSNHYRWDVYHIENYLLEPLYIDRVLGQLGVEHIDLSTSGRIDECLRQIARSQVNSLLLQRLQSNVHDSLRQELSFGADPSSTNIGPEFHATVSNAVDRMRQRLSGDLAVDQICSQMDSERQQLEASLESERRKQHFKGRDVLSAFAGKYANGLRYEYFRDLIVSQMASDGHQPPGMKSVLDRILSEP